MSVDLTSIQYTPAKQNIPPKNQLPKQVEWVIKGGQPIQPNSIPQGAMSLKTITNEANLQEDSTQKKRLILVIHFYLLEFSEKLSSFKPTNLEKMTVDELTSLRDQMDSVLSSQSNLKQTQLMVRSGIQMLEFGISYATPIQCQGLTNLILQDADAVEDIKHVAIKYLSLTPVQPELRLAYRIANATLLLHNINSSKKVVTPSPTHDKPHSPQAHQNTPGILDEINKEFANL